MLLVYYFIVLAPCRIHAYIPKFDNNNSSISLFNHENYKDFKDLPLLNRKIFQGYRVSIMEHPYIVSIRRQVSHYVTGVMIMNSLFITVAQPIFGVPVYELSVVVGENYNDRGIAVNSVLIVVIHEHYDPNTLRANIALLKIYENIIYTMSVKPINLARSRPKDGDTAFVTGWGRCDWTGKELCLPRASTYYRNEYQDPMLRTINFVLKMYSSACEAYKALSGYGSNHNGQLCLGVARDEDIMSPCLAVPGAPLVVNGTLVGIQSWGYACGFIHDLPILYVDFIFYRRWILHNMAVFAGFSEENFKLLYVITKAYWMWHWLNETREYRPTFRSYRDDLQALELDNALVDLLGEVYDIRDSIYSYRYSQYKQSIYARLKKQKLYDSKVQNVHDKLVSNIRVNPFMNVENSEQFVESKNIFEDNNSDDYYYHSGESVIKLLLKTKARNEV